MDEIKRRSSIIDSVLADEALLPPIVRAELCYLQLRMICELIALGCLAVHGDIEATRTGRMRKAYAADWIINSLSGLHPGFYPHASRLVNGDPAKRPRIEPVMTGFLTKEDIISLWRECGDFLHRGTLRSILSNKSRRPNFSPIQTHINKIVTLLNEHLICLINSEEVIWCSMSSGEDGMTEVRFMELVEWIIPQ
jgi:hypothetical protein